MSSKLCMDTAEFISIHKTNALISYKIDINAFACNIKLKRVYLN